jgi:IS4 transposase
LIDWYRARWELELFFDVLKNGCRVEKFQLSSLERLERALALFMVLAWRIARLMHRAWGEPAPIWTRRFCLNPTSGRLRTS